MCRVVDREKHRACRHGLPNAGPGIVQHLWCICVDWVGFERVRFVRSMRVVGVVASAVVVVDGVLVVVGGA